MASVTSIHRAPRQDSFLKRHSLSIVAISLLLLWIVMYAVSDEKTHLGSFFGNAIADWSGVVVTILATKYLFEKGSSESRVDPNPPASPIRYMVREHSLTIFLLITGAAR